MPIKNEKARKEYKHQYYLQNKEKIKRKMREYYLNNREEIIKRVRKYQENNKEKITKRRKVYMKKRNREMKLKVISHYSKGTLRCACKGCPYGPNGSISEVPLEFLSIDHIDGKGGEHRRKLFGSNIGGQNFYHWLIKNNFPEGYQVLCHNCNMAKGFHGQCPHEELK